MSPILVVLENDHLVDALTNTQSQEYEFGRLT